jgi:hypothetical protein
MGGARVERRDQRHSEAIRRVVLLVGAVLVLAGCNGGTVDKHALEKDAESIASLATEGGLLAHKAAIGESTGPFTRVQSETLGRQASNLSDALGERPTSPGIETKVRSAGKLAGLVAHQFELLHRHPTDRAVARSVQEALGPLADQADSLSK